MVDCSSLHNIAVDTVLVRGGGGLERCQSVVLEMRLLIMMMKMLIMMKMLVRLNAAPVVVQLIVGEVGGPRLG